MSAASSQASGKAERAPEWAEDALCPSISPVAPPTRSRPAVRVTILLGDRTQRQPRAQASPGRSCQRARPALRAEGRMLSEGVGTWQRVPGAGTPPGGALPVPPRRCRTGVPAAHLRRPARLRAASTCGSAGVLERAGAAARLPTSPCIYIYKPSRMPGGSRRAQTLREHEHQDAPLDRRVALSRWGRDSSSPCSSHPKGARQARQAASRVARCCSRAHPAGFFHGAGPEVPRQRWGCFGPVK